MFNRYETRPKCIYDNPKEAFLTNWIFDSHWWIEYYPGYFKCSWCNRMGTSGVSIAPTDKLCSKNPAVKNILNSKTKNGDEIVGILYIIKRNITGKCHTVATVNRFGDNTYNLITENIEITNTIRDLHKIDKYAIPSNSQFLEIVGVHISKTLNYSYKIIKINEINEVCSE